MSKQRNTEVCKIRQQVLVYSFFWDASLSSEVRYIDSAAEK